MIIVRVWRTDYVELGALRLSGDNSLTRLIGPATVRHVCVQLSFYFIFHSSKLNVFSVLESGLG